MPSRFLALLTMALLASGAALAPPPLKVMTYTTTTGGYSTPARGWNSFGMQSNDVGANFTFDQAHVTAQCDMMGQKLGNAGYNYCSLDSGWSVGGNGDDNGRILYDADAGWDIPMLADYLHAKGMKLGVYVVPGAFRADFDKTILGTQTKIKDVCSGDEGLARCVFDYTRPEVQTWHNSVVDQFAKWGVDFIKLDFVTPGSPENGQNLPTDQSACVPAWREAIRQTGRPMRLDISWKLDRTEKYFRIWDANAESMRTDQDINNSGEHTFIRWATVQRAIDNYRQYVVTALPLFNKSNNGLRVRPDLDNMYVGNAASITGVSDVQRRTIMTHWIATGANLITGSDLARIDALGLELMTNKAALAVADFAANYPMQPRNPGSGEQGAKQLQAWIAGPDSTGRAVLVLANYGPDQGQGGFGTSLPGKQTVSVMWAELGISGGVQKVTNVWTGEDVTVGKDGISVTLDEGDSLLLSAQII